MTTRSTGSSTIPRHARSGPWRRAGRLDGRTGGRPAPPPTRSRRLAVRRRHRVWLAATIAGSLVTAGLVVATAAHAAGGCSVAYTVTNQWQGGFGANVTVTNLGDPVNGWKLAWSFIAGQGITQLWNGSYTQSGTTVTVTNASWNGAIPTGGNASFGFNGSWTTANPVPASFSLNGVAC